MGKGKAQKRFDEAAFEQAVQYAAEDADLALQLCDKLQAHADRCPAPETLYEQVDLPLVEVLADLELAGVRLDVEVLAAIARDFRAKRDGAEKQVLELAGEAFNLNSPTQLGKILYDKLGLPVLKRTDKTKAPATDEDVLSELAKREDGEIAAQLLVHRQMQKLLGTYVEALPALVNPVTGRLHTRLHQAAVATGRLASSDPNLQNIPIRTEEGRAIRGAFVPEPGWVLLDADYSQIELRVVAALAQDPVLLGAFESGEDIHRRTASEVMGVPMAAGDRGPAQRRQGRELRPALRPGRLRPVGEPGHLLQPGQGLHRALLRAHAQGGRVDRRHQGPGPRRKAWCAPPGAGSGAFPSWSPATPVSRPRGCARP